MLGLSLAGGDMQAQALMQIFLNVAEWGLTPQQAMDHPRFGSYNFPGTGREVNSGPGRLNLEGRIPAETFEALGKLGHKVESWGTLELRLRGWDHHLSGPADRFHHGSRRSPPRDVCAGVLTGTPHSEARELTPSPTARLPSGRSSGWRLANELRLLKLRVPSEPEGPARRHPRQASKRGVITHQSVLGDAPALAFGIPERAIFHLLDEASL